MSDYMLSTRLEFDDRELQGQVLHVGTRESCEKLADFIPAVAYSGDKRVIDSRFVIAPSDPNLPVGTCWRIPKEDRSEPRDE